MSRELRAFQDALIARNVLARCVTADEEHESMEFPTEDALAKYLKEHPRAKPNSHTVKRPKHDDAATPADRKEVEQASKGALHHLDFLQSMLDHHNKKEDANYAMPLREQWPSHAADLRKYVDDMIGGINHIPAGKDRDRAKEIARKLDEAWEAPNKELGFRWNRPDRRAYLPPEHLEKMLQTTKPLVKELDQILNGQRVLMSRVLARHLAADEHEAMEFNTPEALQKYLQEHPKADKSKHTVKKQGEPGAVRAPKPHALDGLPYDLAGNKVIEKAKAKGATKEDIKSAMDEIDKAADMMAEKQLDRPEDTEDEKKLEAAKEHLDEKFHKVVQESPEYKTTKVPEGYYPQKKPHGYRDSEGAAKVKSQLSKEDLAAAESMPDADLDKDEAYNHPRIKALAKSLAGKVKSGELSREDLGKRMGEIEGLRTQLSQGMRSSVSDEEQDGWRFPARQLYKLWQGYNAAIQQAGRDEAARR